MTRSPMPSSSGLHCSPSSAAPPVMNSRVPFCAPNFGPGDGCSQHAHAKFAQARLVRRSLLGADGRTFDIDSAAAGAGAHAVVRIQDLIHGARSRQARGALSATRDVPGVA